jgi:hypothetical protein
MPAPLIIPDHIKEARLTLLCAGIAVDVDSPAFAALMCAAVAYNRIPQVNIAEELRQELSRTKYEMGRVVNDLLTENNRVKRLQDEVRRLRTQVGIQALAA